MLKFAAVLGAAYIDIELKAAPFFFAGGASTTAYSPLHAGLHCQSCSKCAKACLGPSAGRDQDIAALRSQLRVNFIQC